MAEMIPDRLPSGASAGEKKVFALLQQLPDDVIVYYEPVVADRYPDFIVIIPSIGLLVIEVKGWYPNAIERADNAEVVISARGQREVCKHPVRQARDYKFQLMNSRPQPSRDRCTGRNGGPLRRQVRLSLRPPRDPQQLHAAAAGRARAVGGVSP